MNIDQAREFEISDELRFVESEHGFINIEINNARAHALVSTYAGQVLSYRPTNQQHDLLFLSDRACYENGKAIKGGIPLCWPWFGADPEHAGRPAHGFVRTRQWEVSASESLAHGSTRVVLSLADSGETRKTWPHPFKLDIEICVGASLEVALVTHNTGTEGITISQALHTYFLVGDIGKVKVLGLDATNYLDKVDDFARKIQSGPVTFDREVDRIYTDAGAELLIDDASLGRRIRITSAGCSTAVVWNPWSEAAAAMADLGDEDYKKMLCVETANAGPEVIEIAAGCSYRLEAEYQIEGLYGK